MFGLGAVFLLISPQLRLSVYAGLESGINGMEAYSPYSYIGAGVAVLIAGGITLYRGAQAR
jgi:hypothetical protein